jgi:NAD(P)-dependent dehydrogenase (short-subunit alcohol dehydrogenase family)
LGAELSDVRLDGRVAIVTGAGNGIGRAHALLLAARGARVVVNDIGGSVHGDGEDVDPAEAVAAEIRTAGGEAVSDSHSVSIPEGGEAIVETARAAYGRVDILVNNAGILRDKSFANMTPDLLDPVIDVHLKGAFYVARPAWLLMREQQYGRIVNTSSSSGILGNFGQSNYGAAKMGLVGLTRVLAGEGERHNIKVNAIAPSAQTRMTEAVIGALNGHLDPALVSPVVAWLAHEDVPVSGEVLTVGGGRVARFFIGLTPGYFEPTLSPESVRDHFDQILDPTGYTIPSNGAEEMKVMLETFKVDPDA